MWGIEMGLFAYTLALRRTPKMDWTNLKPRLEMFLYGKEASVTDLSQELSGYGMVTLSPDTGAVLPNLAERISKMTGDYVVITQIVDSDFCIAELYFDGKKLQECYIGRIYLEIWLTHRVGKPNMKLWQPLLRDSNDLQQFRKALRGGLLFVEDQLRSISELTGLPILDNDLLDAAPEREIRPLFF